MKKRLLSMLMAVLMIASLVPATAMAAPACEHKNVTEIVVEKNAETKTPGITAKICDDCGVVVGGERGVSVKPFVKPKDYCKTVCTNPVTKELKAATCNNEGLTVVYCGTCGQSIKVVIKEALQHVYKFSVAVAPTCEDDGWGYAICTLCGNAQFVSGPDAVEALISKDAYKTNDVFDNDAYTKAVEATEALYAATGHVAADKVAVVAKDVLDENDEVIAKAAVQPTHAATIGGYPVAYKDGKIVSANTDGAKVPDCSGYTGDKVCPTCGDTENVVNGINTYKGKVLSELNVAHAQYMTTLEQGKKPVYDAVNEEYVDGMTDKVYCSECNKIFGGETITYEDFYGAEPAVPEIGTVKVVEEETVLVVNNKTITAKPASAATCEDKGYTGDTVKYAKVDTDKETGEAICDWIFNDYGKEIPALGHHYVAKESVAATCDEPGHTYKGVYECDRITDEETGDTCGAIKRDVISVDKAIDPLGCDFSVEKVIVEATCQNKGITVLTCSRCGAYETENDVVVAYYTDKVNHVAADELANVVEATCTEAGYSGDQVCKWCGETLKKGEEVPALGHQTELKDAKEATCTEAGFTGDEVCTVCGEVVKAGEEIPALGHKFENGVCTVCGAEDPNYVVPNPFKDVKEDSPYYDAIIWAVKNEVTAGKTADTFGINDGCTRAQIVTFLYRAAGSPEISADVVNPFTDVSKDSEFYNAIMWAVEKKITAGTTETTFSPNAVCTRGQIVTFLFRASGAEKVEADVNFTDVAAGSYCYDAVAWAVANEITAGKTATTFAPNDTCTRGQAVTFIYRASK